jgi:apolipoprotein N-acyltransferase
LRDRIDGMQGQTPIMIWGDTAVQLLALLLLGFSLFFQVRFRK